MLRLTRCDLGQSASEKTHQQGNRSCKPSINTSFNSFSSR
nr:MAG TPA: hypothetical protein [Caudoviricetes sp.]DAW66741.1 MAG TPA: hypothetical protein [Caudoviricetes sp.]